MRLAGISLAVLSVVGLGCAGTNAQQVPTTPTTSTTTTTTLVNVPRTAEARMRERQRAENICSSILPPHPNTGAVDGAGRTLLEFVADSRARCVAHVSEMIGKGLVSKDDAAWASYFKSLLRF